jgi:diacylglycerol kinase family enzyme
VCVVSELTQEEWKVVGPLMPSGDHLDRPEVTYAQGRRIQLEHTGGEPLAIEHDGDPRPAGDSLTIEVVPGAVPVAAAPRSESPSAQFGGL